MCGPNCVRRVGRSKRFMYSARIISSGRPANSRHPNRSRPFIYLCIQFSQPTDKTTKAPAIFHRKTWSSRVLRKTNIQSMRCNLRSAGAKVDVLTIYVGSATQRRGCSNNTKFIIPMRSDCAIMVCEICAKCLRWFTVFMLKRGPLEITRKFKYFHSMSPDPFMCQQSRFFLFIYAQLSQTLVETSRTHVCVAISAIRRKLPTIRTNHIFFLFVYKNRTYIQTPSAHKK